MARLASDPHYALSAPARSISSARFAAPRRLSEKQKSNPLIKKAWERLSCIVENRGKYLRRLDSIHGDRRSRIEKYIALGNIAEAVLLRLDLATSVLGWIDEAGRFNLNAQCRIAEQSGISTGALSRLLSGMEAVGYVYKRAQKNRLDEKNENGLHLVRTKVLIRFTKLFWRDLGLAYLFERAQKRALKNRKLQLQAISQRRSAEIERRSLEQLKRERSTSNWRKAEGRKQAAELSTQTLPPRDYEYARIRHQLIVALAIEQNISASAAAVIADERLASELSRRRT
nr:hypothetical protein [Pseudomonas sp. TH43]